MLSSSYYALIKNILSAPNKVLVAVKIVNPLSYGVFRQGKKTYEITLRDFESALLRAGFKVMRFQDDVFFVLLEPSLISFEVHAVFTEEASNVFLEYVNLAFGYCEIADLSPDVVIRNAMFAASLAEQKMRAMISYSECEKTIEDLSRIVADATTLFNEMKSSVLGAVLQPIVDTQNSELLTYEFLSRMKCDGNVQEYIIAAEKTNLILRLDELVFDKVVELITSRPEISITFNVSIVSIANGYLIRKMLDTFNKNPVIAHRVIVEIEEGAILGETKESVFEFIFSLKAMGCKIALDDFGHNFYLPLVDLEKLPIDYLKLDREFAHKISDEGNTKIFVNGIVDVAKNLGIGIIAEFVENDAIFQSFKEIGVRYMQGYYLHSEYPELHIDALSASR